MTLSRHVSTHALAANDPSLSFTILLLQLILHNNWEYGCTHEEKKTPCINFVQKELEGESILGDYNIHSEYVQSFIPAQFTCG